MLKQTMFKTVSGKVITRKNVSKLVTKDVQKIEDSFANVQQFGLFAISVFLEHGQCGVFDTIVDSLEEMLGGGRAATSNHKKFTGWAKATCNVARKAHPETKKLRFVLNDTKRSNVLLVSENTIANWYDWKADNVPTAPLLWSYDRFFEYMDKVIDNKVGKKWNVDPVLIAVVERVKGDVKVERQRILDAAQTIVSEQRTAPNLVDVEKLSSKQKTKLANKARKAKNKARKAKKLAGTLTAEQAQKKRDKADNEKARADMSPQEKRADTIARKKAEKMEFGKAVTG